MKPVIQKTKPPFINSATVFFSALFVLGCGTKSPYPESNGDTEPRGTDTEQDTATFQDTASAGDYSTDENTDMDAGKDAGTSEPWIWTDNPESEDCGTGCIRLTFEDNIRERQWDIWEDKLVYADWWSRIFVVDIPNKKMLKIPDVYPEYPTRADGTSSAYALHPAIYKDIVYYSMGISSTPHRHELVRANLHASSQVVFWQREDPISEEINYFLPEELDAYGDRLVTSGSTGDPLTRALGYHEAPWPSTGEVLIDRTYGGCNSLWEDILVFWELDGTRENIRGYDFSNKEFFSVTDDDEYQMLSRIHKRRVVYMDLRLGESNTKGTWEHGAIFMKDLDSGEVTQITDGTAIASYPDIYDDIIVWMDWRGCAAPNNKSDLSAIEIWGYNLKTGKTFQITDLPDYQKGFPRIWKDKVYVYMLQEDIEAIYQFELPDGALEEKAEASR